MKIIFIILLPSVPNFGKRKHPESWYQAKVATKWIAKQEVTVVNGRIDILTKEYAIEVEFADKWKDAIGQALWYSIQTNKKAGIILITAPPRDNLHAIRLRSVIAHAKLDIKAWVFSEV